MRNQVPKISNGYNEFFEVLLFYFKVLIDNLLDADSDIFENDLAQIQSECSSITGRNDIYLNKDVLEPWIQDEIEKSVFFGGQSIHVRV